MNDNYVEKLVKKKADTKTMLIRTGVIVLGLLIVGIFKCGILWAYQCFSACMAYLLCILYDIRGV